jgi:hypothetical protein
VRVDQIKALPHLTAKGGSLLHEENKFAEVSHYRYSIIQYHSVHFDYALALPQEIKLSLFQILQQKVEIYCMKKIKLAEVSHYRYSIIQYHNFHFDYALALPHF